MSEPAEPLVRRFQPKPGDAVPLAEFLAGQDKLEAPARSEPAKPQATDVVPGAIPELGGRKEGPDPTRYGDWEKNGRCIDF